MSDATAIGDSTINSVKKEKYVTDFHCNSASCVILIL